MCQRWTQLSSLAGGGRLDHTTRSRHSLSKGNWTSTQGGTRTLTGVAHGALDAARLTLLSAGRHPDPIPGQGIEPRSPRSERGVLPVRRSRSVRLRPTRQSSTQTHLLTRRHAALGLMPSLLCLCHSPTLRPWIAGRIRARLRGGVIVEGLWSPSLVGQMKKRTQKLARMRARYFSAERRGVFLSQAGPRFDLELVQAEHHLSSVVAIASETTKATRLGRPRLARYTARELARTPLSEG